MAICSIVKIFFMSIIFNTLLPSGDVGSDVYLMFNTLTFNLGPGLKLLGCKLCYGKSDNDVYRRRNELEKRKCNWCVTDRDFACGLYPEIIQKMLSYEKDNEVCLTNETFRRTKSGDYGIGDCDKRNDTCCLTTYETNENFNNIQMLDPKILFQCFYIKQKNLHYCYVVGNTSFNFCYGLTKMDKEFKKKRAKVISSIESSSMAKSTFFFAFNQNNDSIDLQQVDSITDIKKCGFLIKREEYFIENDSNHFEYCNEDSCLTHLKTLHKSTTISDLSDWRSKVDYLYGFQVGGAPCKMLKIYGTVMLFPILLNLAFNINVFRQDLRQKKANRFELFTVVFLVYYPYKTIKCLLKYLFCHRNEQQLIYDKNEIERRVAPLEPFLESCLQVSTSL